MSGIRSVGDLPLPLVLVRCKRCRGLAGLFSADPSGAGAWSNDHRHRCRCDPPPQLPEGTELDGLVAQARREMRYDGRAPVTVFR